MEGLLGFNINLVLPKYNCIITAPTIARIPFFQDDSASILSSPRSSLDKIVHRHGIEIAVIYYIDVGSSSQAKFRNANGIINAEIY